MAELESHVEERISSGSYDTHKKLLVPFIHKLLGAKDFSEHLILTATAVLDNNCFEISNPIRNVELGGLFLISLILCHDCVPNTIHYVNFIESAKTDIQRYEMTFETTGESECYVCNFNCQYSYQIVNIKSQNLILRALIFCSLKL